MINRYDYDQGTSTSLELTLDGTFVLFDDYEEALGNLEYDLKALQRKYDLLVDKIGDVYREA